MGTVNAVEVCGHNDEYVGDDGLIRCYDCEGVFRDGSWHRTSRSLPERRELYLTFGSQYSYEPHPVLPFERLDAGFLTVEYGLGSDGSWQKARERARVTAWTFLADGAYSFDYDLRPDHDAEGKLWYPLGEIARLSLP